MAARSAAVSPTSAAQVLTRWPTMSWLPSAIDDGLGVVALGIALAFAFAHEARVGVAQIDLLVGLGRVARGLGLGAFGGAMPLGARVVQRHILCLGEINDAQREGWTRCLQAVDGDRRTRQLAIFPGDRDIPAHAVGFGVQVRLEAMRIERPPRRRR